MTTDFTTWDRRTLERFAREAADHNSELQQDLLTLLDMWRDAVAELDQLRATCRCRDSQTSTQTPSRPGP